MSRNPSQSEAVPRKHPSNSGIQNRVIISRLTFLLNQKITSNGAPGAFWQINKFPNTTLCYFSQHSNRTTTTILPVIVKYMYNHMYIQLHVHLLCTQKYVGFMFRICWHLMFHICFPSFFCWTVSSICVSNSLCDI